ncbi:MAG: hypothetical protein JRF60_06365 [Deltaproteobacteria bacterium]|nr:hypothetical protein [Deltaproteobacteria bacterium]MBW2562876.1 hypothetical protein [Deltaproteobacteria bacterium]
MKGKVEGTEAEGRRKKHQKNEHRTSNVQHRILNEKGFSAVNREPMNLEPEATCGASACAVRATA